MFSAQAIPDLRILSGFFMGAHVLANFTKFIRELAGKVNEMLSPNVFGLKKWEFDDWIKSGAKLTHSGLFAFNSPESQFRDQARDFELRRLGFLKVLSGKILVNDPSLAAEDENSESCFNEFCFLENFPCGNHPVLLLLSDSMLLAVLVRFSEEDLAYLEPAWSGNWKERVLRERILPGFGVDSAHAALFSAESLAAYIKALQEGVDPGDFAPHESAGRESVFEDGCNMFMVSSFGGDGYYNCYIGKAQKGNTISLIVDFGLLGKARPIYSG